MNYSRVYEYRFRGIDQKARQKVWSEIAAFLYQKLKSPRSLLDPAAGRCEFLNAVPASEKWAVDASEDSAQFSGKDVKFIKGDALEVLLPENHFEGVFVSNFLEHLRSHEELSAFLEKAYKALKPGGRMAVMGPNFKFCAKEYFDCVDHRLALSHVAVEEILYATGFEIEDCRAKFIPYSFRSRLPSSSFLTRMYLRLPFVWKLFGKQFLIVAKKPG